MKYTRWISYEKYFKEFTCDVIGDKPVEEIGSLFAVHPHNIFTFGMVFNNYKNRFGANCHILASRTLLNLPGLGLLYMLTGIQGVTYSYKILHY